MHTGMLWFDNSGNPLEKKIKKAVEYYKKKYGVEPNECLVNPSMLRDDGRIAVSFLLDDLIVRPCRPVLPDHIWVGVKEID